MDTREMVFLGLEELSDDLGTLAVPKTSMGNISREEIEFYFGVKGYNVFTRDDGRGKMCFHYTLKGRDFANA